MITTVVKGFKKDLNYKSEIRILLVEFLQEYYPTISIDLKNLVDSIMTRLEIMVNLPIEVVCKTIAKEIDLVINMNFKMYVCDLGVIVSDRIIQKIMEIKTYEFRENKDSKVYKK